MAELFSNTDDGFITSPLSTWAGARDADTGNTVTAGGASATSFTAVARFTSRGGGSTFRVFRSYMYFDTSDITGTVASANFRIVGANGNDGSIIAVKSNAFGGDGETSLSTADLDAIPGWTDGASQEGNVTKYSVAFESTSGTWNENGVNTLTATSDLLADMKNNDVVIVCFLDYTNDYLNVTPSSAGTLNISGRYSEQTNSNLRPRIDFTLATGYTHTVLGVAAANIGKVNTVATANIGKINSLD